MTQLIIHPCIEDVQNLTCPCAKHFVAFSPPKREKKSKAAKRRKCAAFLRLKKGENDIEHSRSVLDGGFNSSQFV